MSELDPFCIWCEEPIHPDEVLLCVNCNNTVCCDDAKICIACGDCYCGHCEKAFREGLCPACLQDRAQELVPGSSSDDE